LKAHEARGYLTAKPSNKVKCNIILLQMAQGKFTNPVKATAAKMGYGGKV